MFVKVRCQKTLNGAIWFDVMRIQCILALKNATFLTVRKTQKYEGNRHHWLFLISGTLEHFLSPGCREDCKKITYLRVSPFWLKYHSSRLIRLG